jgi:hypothetical protein
MLAFENERQRVFAAVHHLTVATYSLQHPAGYRHQVLAAWKSLLADALGGDATPATLRRRFGEQFAGSIRVLEPGAQPPAGWPAIWPMRVQDVFNPLEALPDEDEYVARAIAWASGTCGALGESDVSWDRISWKR